MVCAALLAGSGFLHADTPLETSMEHLAKAYKALTLGLEKPDNSAIKTYSTLAATIKTEAVKARDQVPQKADSLSPAEKSEFLKSYQESMDEFIATIEQLQKHIDSAKWDAARKDLASLKKQMREGHREFKRKE